MAEIALKASGGGLIPLRVAGGGSVSMGIEQLRVEIIDRPPYTGAYEVTPGAAAVVLPTSGLRMTGDIIVDPIPGNYGLVSWDGSVLTVS